MGFAWKVGLSMVVVALVAILVVNGQLAAALQDALPADVWEAHRASLRREIDGALLVALVPALLLGGFLALRLSGPLAEVRRVLASLGGGDLARRVPEPAASRAGALGAVTNQMAERVQERERRLLEDASRRAALFQAMDDGVLAVDADERVVLVNDAACRLLGHGDRTLRGARLSEVTRVSEVLDAARGVLGRGERVSVELSIPSDEGERTLLLTGAPVRDEVDVVTQAVLVLREVTDLRRLEAVRRDFVANVTHELKTPLTSMRGFVEAIIDDDDMDPEQRGVFLEKARTATDRLVAIVSDLLDLARLDQPQDLRRLGPVDLREVVAEALAASGPAAEAKAVELAHDFPTSSVVVHGDEGGLVAAVGNLVDNAVKYSPAGDRVEVVLWAEDGAALVEVRDRGPGIPAHAQERIFERFFRVDKDRSRELGGTGLGLSIVKNVCLAHGGEVSVTSALDVGTVFRVRLPLG